MAEELVLEMRGIRKEFPGVIANDDVNFDVRRGEVHALLGENGAGKSTLMNIIYGLYRHDAGEIVLYGKPVGFGSARDAIQAGIGMVHQHFILISHKLNEVLEIADRITVLRRGKTIETVPAAGATEASLARAMVGREVLLRVEKAPAAPGDVLLSVADLQVRDDRGISKVRGVSFDARAGE